MQKATFECVFHFLHTKFVPFLLFSASLDFNFFFISFILGLRTSPFWILPRQNKNKNKKNFFGKAERPVEDKDKERHFTFYLKNLHFRSRLLIKYNLFIPSHIIDIVPYISRLVNFSQHLREVGKFARKNIQFSLTAIFSTISCPFLCRGEKYQIYEKLKHFHSLPFSYLM